MDHNEDIIDRYLHNQLSDEELLEVKKRLAEDAAFKAEVAEREAIHHGILAFGNEELKTELDLIHQEEVEKKKVVKPEVKTPRRIIPWSIAAAITVILIALAYLFFPKDTMNNNDLFTKYYAPYKTSIAERGSTVADKLIQIEQLYQQKSFNEVIPLVDDVMKSQGTNAKLQLILGIAHLESGDLEKALFLFGDIDNPLYDDKAKWYSALI